MILDWADVTVQALQNLWQGFLIFIPALIFAIIVFVIGWFFAVGAGKLITEILKRVKFDQIFEGGGWKTALQRAEIKVDVSGFIGAIVKWVLIIFVLKIAIGILGWADFAIILGKAIDYLPNVIVAALIFVVAVIVADILQKIVIAATERARVTYTRLAGIIVKWSIWIFAILAILYHLRIASPFMEILFTGLVGMLVISLGIAFGLGGRDVAAEILQDLKRKLKE